MNKKIVGIYVSMLMVVAAMIPVVATGSETAPCAECASPADQIIKWEQLPDMTPNGTDVSATTDPNIPRLLADDFRCVTPGFITGVHLFGSWFQDIKGVIKVIHLSIHEDIPANQSPTKYSMPGKMLWQANFSAGQFSEKIFHEGMAEWWYDPYTGLLVPNADHAIWEYDINISATQAFMQKGTTSKPIIYWLDANVQTQTGLFGWKTAAKQWNDDAVYRVPPPELWKELRFPPGHPLKDRSIDLAFRIITTPVCCFKVTFPRFNFFGVGAKVTETCNLSHTNVPWNITVTYGSTHKYYTGTIASIGPGASVTIHSGILFYFGPVTVTVKVDVCPPIEKRMFILLIIFIALT